ncbi:prepilin peptidase [Paenalcaligenes sp. Me131]|uniref:prepilin peptidase n=1 Tax=Paenalcaligenes sp. Me131 TaxID=3392636 RepID=UPI003D2B7F8D
MLYLLCSIVAVVLTAFAQGWATSYALILQQGATPNCRSLSRAAQKTLMNPWGWWRIPRWPHSYWHRGCAVFFIGLAVFLSMAYLHAVAQRMMLGQLSWGMGVWYGGLTLALLFLAWCDLYTRLLPDAVTITLIVLPWLIQGWFTVALTTASTVWWLVVALYIGYRCCLPFIHKPPIGAGDIKLYLGLWAISPHYHAGFLLILIAAVACWFIQACWQKRCLPRGACAFGPYLCLAYSVINVWESGLHVGFPPYGF